MLRGTSVTRAPDHVPNPRARASSAYTTEYGFAAATGSAPAPQNHVLLMASLPSDSRRAFTSCPERIICASVIAERHRRSAGSRPNTLRPFASASGVVRGASPAGMRTYQRSGDGAVNSSPSDAKCDCSAPMSSCASAGVTWSADES